MREVEVVVYAGSIDGDPTSALAASGAGGLGVLDLTYATDAATATDRLAGLLAAGGEVGVKFDAAQSDEIVDAIVDGLGPPITTVVLVPMPGARTAEVVTR